MRRAWRWAKARPGLTVAFFAAFLVGLFVGGVLGWRGLGHRTIDWGTAGEWVPGVLTGAATVGALWWAISQFHAERQDRHRYEQRLTLGELRAAVEAVESTLTAIGVEIVTRAGGNSANAKPLAPLDPLVVTHKDAHRRVDVLLSELDDQRVANDAQAYLDAIRPVVTPSSAGGPDLVKEIKEALDRRVELYERLRDGIGAARMALVSRPSDGASSGGTTARFHHAEPDDGAAQKRTRGV
jgi:hypothetical protein